MCKTNDSFSVNNKEAEHGHRKSIVGNTIVLSIRMFVLMIVNLYAVRIILERLGAQDFGLYNVVTGFVALTSFINGSVDIAIQRFYSLSIGMGNMTRMKDVFSSSVKLMSSFSIITFVIFEIVGLWFINTQMVLPTNRLYAVELSFQFALLIFLMTIMQIPYTAAIYAHEDMKVYAVFSTVECLLRLLAAVMIGHSCIDKLVFYSAELFVISLLIFSLYVYYGRKHYKECHYGNIQDKTLIRQLLTFSGWTMLGPAARVGMIQGNTILLNVFYGPLVNAAFAIAMQINNAFGTLANCVVLAIRSPMTIAYAKKRNDYLGTLFYGGTKILFFLLLSVSIPIFWEMDIIIRWWLGNDIAEGTILFSRLSIVSIVLLALSNPITIIIYAIGEVKKYHIMVESVTLLCLPIAWFVFNLGFPAYNIFVVMIMVIIVAHIVRVVFLKNVYADFSIRQYMVSLCLPAFIGCFICLALARAIHVTIGLPFVRVVIEAICTIIVSAIIAYNIGSTTKEREACRELIQELFKKSKI